MASIVERPRANAPSTWQVHIRVKNQPRQVQTFDSREDAEFFAQRTEAQLRKLATEDAKEALRAVSEDILEMKLSEVIHRFMQRPQVAAHHKTFYRSVLRQIGSVKLKQLRHKWVVDYIAKMRSTLTNRQAPYTYDSIDSHLRLISQAMKWQAQQLDVAMPPLPYSTATMFPRNWESKRERRLEVDEEKRLLGRLKSIPKHVASRWHWRLLVRFAIETAARQQELILADWKEFSTSTNVWVIPASHTKSGKERSVPLSKKARRLLRILIKIRSPFSQRVFHTLPNPHSVSVVFHRFVADAGIDNFRFHDLRHEAISRMVINKRQLSPFEIMRIVGHSNLDMLNRYTAMRFDEMVARME